MARKAATKKANGNGELGFEATLWAAADTLRNNIVEHVCVDRLDAVTP